MLRFSAARGFESRGFVLFCRTSTNLAVDFIEKSHFHVEHIDMENVHLPLEATNFETEFYSTLGLVF